MTDQEKNFENWLNRWALFQEMEEGYAKRLFPIAYEMVLLTVNDYSPKDKNWTYRKLCTGEIVSDIKRLDILERWINELRNTITQPGDLFFGDQDHVRSQLFNAACFILSWLETDWPEEQIKESAVKK